MKKYTLTIGIPAYNEEGNIERLIKQILNQRDYNFKLEKVYILSDGSSDSTNVIVRRLSKLNKIVILVETEIRHGKIFQLNKLYKLNKSEILLNLDADVSLKDNYVLAQTVDVMHMNSEASVVAIHQIPIKPDDFVGKCIYAGYEFWDQARLSVPDSDHIQNLYGAATAYKGSFTNNFQFPENITDDRGYLYISAKNAGGFIYNKGSYINYLPVSTLHDFRKLADRSFEKNRDELKIYFGDEVDKLYYIPKTLIVTAVLKVFIKSPVYCFIALALNMYSRLFPLHDNLYNSHMWEVSKSTKFINYI